MALHSQKVPDGARTVYKFYNHSTANGDRYYSAFRGERVDLVPETEVVSERESVDLTQDERLTSFVGEGIHSFQSIEDMQAYIKEWDFPKALWNGKYVFAELEGQADDFVASGTFMGFHACVYTKLTFKKFFDCPIV